MTAGWDAYLTGMLTSTEIQLTRVSPWRVAEPYPLSVSGLRGATVDNVVYMTGR